MIGNRGCELFRRDLESCVDVRIYGHRDAIGDAYHIGIGHPAGRRYDSLIAGPEQRHAGIEQRVFGTDRYQDLLRRIVERIVALEFGGDGLFERINAVYGGVLGMTRGNGLCSSLFDVLWRIKIGFAGSKADDVASCRLELHGYAHQRIGCRGRHAAHTF